MGQGDKKFDFRRLKDMNYEEKVKFFRELEENSISIASFDYDPLINAALDAGNKELFNALVERKKELRAKEDEVRSLLGYEGKF